MFPEKNLSEILQVFTSCMGNISAAVDSLQAHQELPASSKHASPIKQKQKGLQGHPHKKPPRTAPAPSLPPAQEVSTAKITPEEAGTKPPEKLFSLLR
jgi:hypothetical protein